MAANWNLKTELRWSYRHRSHMITTSINTRTRERRMKERIQNKTQKSYDNHGIDTRARPGRERGRIHI